MSRTLLILAAAAAGFAAVLAASSTDKKAHRLTSVSIRKMADSIHAVVAADGQAYARLVDKERQADEQRLPVAENWRAAHSLPVHARMLREASQDIQKRGAEFSYVLRSLWPVNENNGPQTQAEQDGLEQVTRNPDENYYIEEELGGRSYFTAIYPDRATLSSCVECHNRHPRSPRRDFNLNDVMGAIVVRVPLEF